MCPRGTWDANMTQPEPDVATLHHDTRGLDASGSHSFAEVEPPSLQEALRDVETGCPQSCWSVVSLSGVSVLPNKIPLVFLKKS